MTTTAMPLSRANAPAELIGVLEANVAKVLRGRKRSGMQ